MPFDQRSLIYQEEWFPGGPSIPKNMIFLKNGKIHQKYKNSKMSINICQKKAIPLWPEVSNPSGSVVSGWTKITQKLDFFEKQKKIILNTKTQKHLEICQNLRYTLWLEVSTPLGSVVSTLFCKAKSDKNNNNIFLLFGDFRPFPIKKVQIWDHFFPLLLTKDSESLKILDIRLQEVGGKKTFKRYLKSKQTHTQTANSTYRKHHPRGPMLWKS